MIGDVSNAPSLPWPWYVAVLAGLAALSQGIGVWQLLAGIQFPLHRRMPVSPDRRPPGISLLKPIKGLDTESERCLRSWLTQDYTGPVQLLIGVKDSGDPVCEVVRSLLREFPAFDAQLVICPDQPGANAKVCTLIQLQALVRHPVILVSDADVSVEADFLTQAVIPFEDPKVGLVNCFYELANPGTWAHQWEAVSVNADFWSQVLQSCMLKPQDFALGATMAIRREVLQHVGGFEAIADYLADDYQLGKRTVAAGWKLFLSPVVVACWESPPSFRQVWTHQLRWSRTVRVCQPGPYAASIIGNSGFWTLLTLGVGWRHPEILLGGSVALGLRLAQANALIHRLTGRPMGFWRSSLYVPMKDLLGAVIWALAFFGNTVVWRNLRYRVGTDGKLTRL